MSVILLILGLIMFVGLVVVHEYGHFIMARRGGVEVEEFGIGFPPRAKVLTKKNGTTYTLNWLPLGGFVKLKGEHDSDITKGSFGAATVPTKIKIMVAGVVMNLLTAFIIFTVLAVVGMPTIIKDQFTVNSDAKIVKEVNNKGQVAVADVVKDSPAAEVGIKKDDVLVAIGGKPIRDVEAVRDIAMSRAGQITAVTFNQAGQEITKSVIFNNGQDNKGYLGVTTVSNESGLQVRRYTWSAPVVSVGFMKQITVLTLKGLGTATKGFGSLLAGLVTGNSQARKEGQAKATEQVSGPIGIYFILKLGSTLGIQFIMMIVGIISLTLAIMNILPIPALDGGRLFVMLLFKAFRRKLLPTTEDKIHGTGFAVLMVLILLISFVDVGRFHLIGNFLK